MNEKQQVSKQRRHGIIPRQHRRPERRTYMYTDVEENDAETDSHIHSPLVYIANVGMHDYSATLNWTPLGMAGIRKVTSGDIDRKNPERLVYNVVQSLKRFREQDYFVFSGSPIPFAIGLSYLFTKLEKVQVLYYLKNKNEYFLITYTRDMFEKAENIDFITEHENISY